MHGVLILCCYSPYNFYGCVLRHAMSRKFLLEILLRLFYPNLTSCFSREYLYNFLPISTASCLEVKFKIFPANGKMSIILIAFILGFTSQEPVKVPIEL